MIPHRILHVCQMPSSPPPPPPPARPPRLRPWKMRRYCTHSHLWRPKVFAMSCMPRPISPPQQPRISRSFATAFAPSAQGARQACFPATRGEGASSPRIVPVSPPPVVFGPGVARHATAAPRPTACAATSCAPSRRWRRCPPAQWRRPERQVHRRRPACNRGRAVGRDID